MLEAAHRGGGPGGGTDRRSGRVDRCSSRHLYPRGYTTRQSGGHHGRRRRPGRRSLRAHRGAPSPAHARAAQRAHRDRGVARLPRGTGSRPTSGSAWARWASPTWCSPSRRSIARRASSTARPRPWRIRPQGDADDPRGAVDIVYTGQGRAGTTERIRYDYLVNATGPKLRFEATHGLGPDRATRCRSAPPTTRPRPPQRWPPPSTGSGRRAEQTLVVGMGHGTCTCEGAAFEYVFNVDHELREAGVRDRARLVYLTNEAQLGDFGVDGMTFEEQGFQTILASCGPPRCSASAASRRSSGAHVTEVEPGSGPLRDAGRADHELGFDFAMLLPPFGGVRLAAYDAGEDITSPSPLRPQRLHEGRRRLHARSPTRSGGPGLARRPTRRPATTTSSPSASPSPRRTRSPGPAPVAQRHTDHTVTATHRHALGHHGQDGRHDDRRTGSGTATTRQAHQRLDGPHGRGLRGLGRHRPAQGLGCGDDDDARRARLLPLPHRPRPVSSTRGEIGLSGHWVKLMLHHLFLHKAKARLGWQFIPE